MKKIKCLCYLCLIVFLPNICHAELEDWGFKPNLGFDVGAMTQSFETSFGDRHFSHRYPMANFYLGTYMHKYLGFEVGYEYMFEQTKEAFYNNTTPTLGFLSQIPGNRTYLSHISLQGPHLDLKGYWPFREGSEFEFSLGLAWIKMHLQTLLIQTGMAANRPTIWKSDRRSMVRAGLGLRQKLSKRFGARILWIWENTSKLETTIPVGVDSGGVTVPSVMVHNYTVKPKNANTVSLGFYYQADPLAKD